MYDRKAIMQTAWADARRRADTFGTKVRDELKLALKQAWAAAKKAAAPVAAPVPAPSFGEQLWAPQLADIAAREAAGTATDIDASIRLLAAETIAREASLAAHIARAQAIAARFA